MRAQARARDPAELWWSTPVVGETWDGMLNDVAGQHVTAEHARAALEAAHGGKVEEGSVGGGTGMVCHEFKGGIGTASRRAGTGEVSYTVGVLVQANHGARRQLRIAGLPVGITEVVKDGGRQIVANTKSDADGTFRALVKPGDVGVGIFGFGSFAKPTGYLPQPENQQAANVLVSAGKTHTFPDIVLEPCVEVEGVVVDVAGKPLPCVSVLTAHDVTGRPSEPVTDAAGRFRLTDLGRDDVTALRARTPTATLRRTAAR